MRSKLSRVNKHEYSFSKSQKKRNIDDNKSLWWLNIARRFFLDFLSEKNLDSVLEAKVAHIWSDNDCDDNVSETNVNIDLNWVREF